MPPYIQILEHESDYLRYAQEMKRRFEIDVILEEDGDSAYGYKSKRNLLAKLKEKIRLQMVR